MLIDLSKEEINIILSGLEETKRWLSGIGMQPSDIHNELVLKLLIARENRKE